MSVVEAERTTLKDFYLYSKAQEKKTEQETRQLAVQAWLNMTVQATKKSGKSAYNSFEDFYNKSFKSEPTPELKQRKLSMAERNRRMNQRRKEGEDGR